MGARELELPVGHDAQILFGDIQYTYTAQSLLCGTQITLHNARIVDRATIAASYIRVHSRVFADHPIYIALSRYRARAHTASPRCASGNLPACSGVPTPEQRSLLNLYAKEGNMRHRSIATPALVLAALLLGGCGDLAPVSMQQPAEPTQRVPASPSPGTASDAAAGLDQLYVRHSSGAAEDRVVVLNGVDGAGLRELPFGLPAPDWSVLYAVEARNGQTTIRALDTASGRVLRQTVVEGTYGLPATDLDGTLSGLSPNGKWLALTEDPGAYGGARSGSRFVVLDTMFQQPARSLQLNGTFSFDAISNSGQSLYLIEHLVPERPEEYRVRLYNLAAGALDTRVIADKRRAPQLMAGTRHSTIASPDGSWLYSMYLNAHHGPFIHALNLNDAYALCIFLPAQAKEDWERQLHWAVAMNQGGVLYAVNGALGIVAEIDRAQNSIRRSAELGTAPAAEEAMALPSRPEQPGQLPHLAPQAGAARKATGGAALTPDGKTLWTSGQNGLLAIATSDLSLRGQYFTDRVFSSLALSGDGERVYAVDAEHDTMLRIDAASGTLAEQLKAAYGASRMLRIQTQR